MASAIPIGANLDKCEPRQEPALGAEQPTHGLQVTADSVSCNGEQEVAARERLIYRVNERGFFEFRMGRPDRCKNRVLASQSARFFKARFQVGIRPLRQERRVFKQLCDDFAPRFRVAPQLARREQGVPWPKHRAVARNTFEEPYRNGSSRQSGTKLSP